MSCDVCQRGLTNYTGPITGWGGLCEINQRDECLDCHIGHLVKDMIKKIVSFFEISDL
jgi:hypothetical protein